MFPLTPVWAFGFSSFCWESVRVAAVNHSKRSRAAVCSGVLGQKLCDSLSRPPPVADSFHFFILYSFICFCLSSWMLGGVFTTKLGIKLFFMIQYNTFPSSDSKDLPTITNIPLFMTVYMQPVFWGFFLDYTYLMYSAFSHVPLFVCLSHPH